MRLKRTIRKRLQRYSEKWKASGLYKWIDRRICASNQKKLENDNFTILCSNCIGGTIYHRFGKRFLSPTINMCFSQPDFAQFCRHLDYYLAQSLCFIESAAPYPVAQLPGDGSDIPTITLNFNHDKLPEEARAKWDERKQRIVRDNLFIILYNMDGITVEELRALEQVPCRNKVVFTAEPLPEISWSYYIKPKLSYQFPYAYLGKDFFGVRHYEKKFDVAAFLNR